MKRRPRAKKKHQVKERYGNLAVVMESTRNTRYFALLLPTPGKLPGSWNEANLRIVDVRTLRAPALRDATTRACEAAEKGQISPGDLEIVLDYLFAELNTRYQKRIK